MCRDDRPGRPIDTRNVGFITGAKNFPKHGAVFCRERFVTVPTYKSHGFVNGTVKNRSLQ